MEYHVMVIFTSGLSREGEPAHTPNPRKVGRKGKKEEEKRRTKGKMKKKEKWKSKGEIKKKEKKKRKRKENIRKP